VITLVLALGLLAVLVFLAWSGDGRSSIDTRLRRNRATRSTVPL